MTLLSLCVRWSEANCRRFTKSLICFYSKQVKLRNLKVCHTRFVAKDSRLYHLKRRSSSVRRTCDKVTMCQKNESKTQWFIEDCASETSTKLQPQTDRVSEAHGIHSDRGFRSMSVSASSVVLNTEGEWPWKWPQVSRQTHCLSSFQCFCMFGMGYLVHQTYWKSDWKILQWIPGSKRPLLCSMLFTINSIS